MSNGITLTGNAADLAILGKGWFELRHPGSEARYYTRVGEFNTDISGYLVNTARLRVQGVTNMTTQAQGDVCIFNRSWNALPDQPTLASGLTSYQFLQDGTVRGRLLDGAEYTIARLTITQFQEGVVFQRVASDLFEVAGPSPPETRNTLRGTNMQMRFQVGALEIQREPASARMLRNAAPGVPANEGCISWTGQSTDLAISGPGYFLVREVSTGEFFATRVGMFLLDGDGYLITYDRKRVQGRVDDSVALPKDIRLRSMNSDDRGENQAAMGSFAIDQVGAINVRRMDGSEELGADRLGIFEFQLPGELSGAGLGQLRGVAKAVPKPIRLPMVPAEPPLGLWPVTGRGPRIHTGALEMINVPAALIELRRRLRLVPQGAITSTGTNTHLAISGQGYFLVRNPADGMTYARRQGDFHMDADGYLLSPEGYRVQGLTDTGLTRLGDIQVNAEGRPPYAGATATLQALSFRPDGAIWVRLSDGTEFVRGRVMLQKFREPFMLRQLPSKLITDLRVAGQEATMVTPGTAGMGRIEGSTLESEPAPEELPSPLPKGVPRLHLLSEPDTRLRIEVTTNFRDWELVAEVLNLTGQMEWADQQAGGATSRIYRILPVPK